MATLKDHQQAMVDLLASGSGIPASASRLAHAMHDVLIYINGDNVTLSSITGAETVEYRPPVECGVGGLPDRPFLKRPDATTPGLNDKALAGDIEACRPKATPAERRVKELENTVRQLRANNAKLKEERDYWITTCRGAEQTLIRTRQELETTKALPEQAGCRKPDTQMCEHPEDCIDERLMWCSKCENFL